MNSYTIPLGPLHVALEEPIYFSIEAVGDRVRSVEIKAGYVHRGMEALVLKRNIYQNLTLLERVCSLCSNNHPFTYCMALEKIADISVPERAEYLRMIADEIKRISSHLFNAAMLAHFSGAHPLFKQTMELREVLQDTKEGIYGNRMDLAANCIGGVRSDLTREQGKYLLSNLETIKKPLEIITVLYDRDIKVNQSLEGLGVLTAENAIKVGAVGPVARASGIDYDVRLKTPYAAYDRVKFSSVTEKAGDTKARVIVRLHEIKEAIGIIEQCVTDMPEGPISLKYMPKIPAGEAVIKSEAPRGELLYYVRTNGTDMPQRIKWRVPTYMNWEALKTMLPGTRIDDVPLVISSIDPCISCTDR